jgi:hypothetical protein
MRAYGNHLGLDGATLAEPFLLRATLLFPAGPEPPGQAGGLQSRAAVTMVAFLLLTVAAGVTYYALHRLHPGIPKAVLSMVDPKARNQAKWTDNAPLAAGAQARTSSPASASEADKAVPNEDQPLASGIAVPELLSVTSQSAAVQPVVELALVPPAETPTAYDERNRVRLFGVDSTR